MEANGMRLLMERNGLHNSKYPARSAAVGPRWLIRQIHTQSVLHGKARAPIRGFSTQAYRPISTRLGHHSRRSRAYGAVSAHPWLITTGKSMQRGKAWTPMKVSGFLLPVQM